MLKTLLKIRNKAIGISYHNNLKASVDNLNNMLKIANTEATKNEVTQIESCIRKLEFIQATSQIINNNE